MKKFYSICCVAALAITATLFHGCNLVNIDEVDNINTESQLFKGQEIEVLKEYSKTLAELIGENAGSVIKVNGDGNYQIEYKIVDNQTIGDGFSFDASQFAINLSGGASKSLELSESTIPANTPVSYDPADKATLQTLFPNLNLDLLDGFDSDEISFNFNLDCSIANFPTLIKAFQKADLDGKLNFVLTPSGIPFNKIVFKKGTSISFPSFLRFSSCDNSSFELQNENVLVAKNDIALNIDKGLSLGLTLKSLDMGNGIEVTEAGLPLAGDVSFSGVVSIAADDFNGKTKDVVLGSHSATVVESDIPVNFSVSYSYEAKNVQLKNAVIKISEDALPAFDAGKFGFDINADDLPSFLTGKNVNVELSNVQVNLTLGSQLPFGFGLNAKLAAVSEQTKTFQFGPLAFPANAVTSYSLGTHADGEEGGIIYKNIPGIGGILSPIPTRIELQEFQVDFDGDEWITVESGKNYGGTLTASVVAPVAFTENTQVSLDLDIDDINIDFGEQVNGLLKGKTTGVIKLHAENEIPLNFGIDLVAKDADKKVIDNVEVSVNKDIASGFILNPTSTDIEITVVLPENTSMIKYMGLNMRTYADKQFASLPLMPNQKITIKNVTFGLPNGITVDVKDVVNK